MKYDMEEDHTIECQVCNAVECEEDCTCISEVGIVRLKLVQKIWPGVIFLMLFVIYVFGTIDIYQSQDHYSVTRVVMARKMY